MNILLVDDEVDLVEIMEFLIQNLLPSEAVIHRAYTGFSAIEILKANTIDVCICDHNMPDGMGSDVLKFLIESKSRTKFVLCSTVTPKERPRDYPAEHVFTNIQKPDVGMGLENLVKLLEKEHENEKEKEKEKRPADVFVPVSIYLLELMEKMPSDVYIKMSDAHFVKVLKAEETFTNEDKKKYATKPLEMLYLKKGEQKESVLRIVESALHKVMDKNSVSLEDKLSITHSQLVELIKFTGISSELADITKKNIQKSVEIINKSPMLAEFWKGLVLMGEYPSKLYTLHSMLASVIVKKMQWHSDATMFKLTLASFLQDISLDSIALMELCDYQEFLANEDRLSRAEVKRYLEHPQRAVELITNFKEIPPDIDRILIEQHEMPNGEGFPKKLSATQLGPLTCVFILTGIFARFILREGANFKMNSLLEILEERGYSRGNFKEVFDAMKSIKN